MNLTEDEIQKIKDAIDSIRKNVEHDGENTKFAKQAMRIVVDLCREGFTRDEAIGILKAAMISKR